jgi:peptidoglycan/LPS O-acetylase OafA/YrhL
MTIEAQPRLAVSTGRSLFFDLSRGLASQLVLVGHSLNVALPAWLMTEGENGLLTARHGLPYLQNFGVLVFFYLSGFLITTSVLRKSGKPGFGLPHFLADRFARIFTPLLPLLVLVFLIDNLVFAGGERSAYSDVNSGFGDLLLNATMLAGNPALSFAAERTGLTWLSAASFGTADQLWTVIIEWWIYIAFGAGFFALVRRHSWGWLGNLAALGLVAIAAAVLLGAALTTPGLLVAWAIGMAAAGANDRVAGQSRARLTVIALAALAAALVLLIGNGWNFYAPLPALLIGVAFFGPVFALDRFAVVADSRVLSAATRFVSNVSYSLYLVHLSLIIWLAELFPGLIGHPASVALLFVAGNLAAWLFYLAFERHYPAVRRRMEPLLDALPARPRALSPKP